MIGWICDTMQVHPIFLDERNFSKPSKATALPTPTGYSHRLASSHPKPGGHPGRDPMADHLYIYPELFPCTHRHQPGANFRGFGELSRDDQGPNFLGDYRADNVFHHCLGGAGNGSGNGNCPIDPFASMGLEVPAIQLNHPMGSGDDCQWCHVALDLQCRFWGVEWTLNATGVNQALRPLADLSQFGDAAGDPGGCLAYDAFCGAYSAGGTGNPADRAGRGSCSRWGQCPPAILANSASLAPPGNPGGADRPCGGR